MTAKPRDEVEDQWDLMPLGGAVPGPDEPFEAMAPTEEENSCSFEAG